MIALYDTDGTVAKTVETIRNDFESGSLPCEGRVGRVSWRIVREDVLMDDSDNPEVREAETLYIDLGRGEDVCGERIA